MDKVKLESLLITADTNIKQAMQKLNETSEKILFIVDGRKKLIGTVTDGDIRRGIIDGLQLTVTINEIMRKKFISVKDNCTDLKKKAKKLMQQYLVEQIPVVNERGLIVDVILWIDCLSSEIKYKNKTMLPNPVIIMAGGKGTRLDPFTKILPKPLIPLGEKPVIEHIMDRFYLNGFYKFILIVNYKKEMIKLYFSENHYPYEVEFIDESEYYGTAGGLSLIRNNVKDTFILTNCDTILEGDYIDFYNWHKEKQNLITIVSSHKEIIIPYGVLNMSNGSFVNIEEKPKFDLFINTGTYVMECDVLQNIIENELLDMDMLINKVNSIHNKKIGAYPHWGGWFDIGQWEEYKKTLKFFKETSD